jgi:hypothetical protein
MGIFNEDDMRNVMIGVPVLMTNCQVSLNRNIGSRMPVKEGGSGETQGEGRSRRLVTTATHWPNDGAAA